MQYSTTFLSSYHPADDLQLDTFTSYSSFQLARTMPKGEDLESDVKQLMFRIIKFVDSEKEGTVIPLYNTTGRLEAMLGVSRATVFRLRNEMHSLEDEETEDDETEVDEDKIILRQRTVSESSILPKGSRRKRKFSANVPVAGAPRKKGNSGRKAIQLTEQQQDQIR
jgi:hypothetical protein